VPLVLRWAESRWETLVFEAASGDEAERPGPDAAIQRTQQTASVLHPGRDGTLWIGQIYRHRLLQVARNGRLLREVRVGDGRPARV
jgi:hypothetical protein